MSKATRHHHTLLERLRQPLSRVIALFFFALLIFTAPAPTTFGPAVFEATGLLLGVIGVMGRLWSGLYISGLKNATLCEDGPYSVSRNALYFFSFIGLLGITLYTQMGLLTLIVAPLFLFYYHFVITSEEKRLTEIFGAPYQQYLARVPRFFPNWALFHSRPSFTVEPARLVKAGNDVIWFFLALIFLGVVKHLHTLGLIPTYFTWPF